MSQKISLFAKHTITIQGIDFKCKRISAKLMEQFHTSEAQLISTLKKDEINERVILDHFENLIELICTFLVDVEGFEERFPNEINEKKEFIELIPKEILIELTREFMKFSSRLIEQNEKKCENGSEETPIQN